MATFTESLPADRARAEFDAIAQNLRPQLLRYCARLTGSAVDGEDIVQDTLVKAYGSLAKAPPVTNLRQWLFRIAHNQAIDHLRRLGRWRAEPLEIDAPSQTQESPLENKELATIALSFFLKITPMQRSCVFLKDVMGHTLNEICEFHDASLEAVKAALHRGRARLRELSAHVGPGVAPPLDESEADRLGTYVDRFNARDFDAVRAMLAADVRLDLVSRAKMRGAEEVGGYFQNYSNLNDWRFARGFVDRRPAILVYDPRDPSGPPSYFVLIEWVNGRIALIRDYRYARHVISEAEIGFA
jgi:RNA polymerase sigma-70 factor (ECF subfamily)